MIRTSKTPSWGSSRVIFRCRQNNEQKLAWNSSDHRHVSGDVNAKGEELKVGLKTLHPSLLLSQALTEAIWKRRIRAATEELFNTDQIKLLIL